MTQDEKQLLLIDLYARTNRKYPHVWTIVGGLYNLKPKK